jgi:sarcosine oxidase subunit beta
MVDKDVDNARDWSEGVIMDFVIVGGGVYGAGVAWELARRGAEVLLVEAQQIAAGASGGLGKRGVRANGRDLRELPLMRLAYALWPYLTDEIGAPTGYERTGNLHLIEQERDYYGAPAQAWAQEQQGIPTQVMGAAALREIEPDLSDRVIAALYCPKDGIADQTATTRGLAQAAQRLGAVIREDTPVVSLERRGDHISAVITAQQERIAVDRMLFLLANTHVPALLQEQLSITLPVWRILPQVVLTQPVAPVTVRHLIGHAHRRLAIKSTPQGHIMISGGWRGRWNPGTERGDTQEDQVRGNVAEAVAVYPRLKGARIIEAAADRPESQSTDGIPIIDLVPGIANAFFATGWTGHGWAIAPAVCQLLATWAYSGEAPALLHPFAYTRFLA